MERDEILRKINYHGKYTKSVKKELNKLLKKYHPDNNKTDKKTILVLYEVKKELENGTLLVEEEKDEVIDNSTHVLFLEKMIQSLIIKKEKINKKIDNLYNKLNKYIEEINNKKDDLSMAEFNVSEVKEEIDNITKINFFDKLSITFIIIFSLLTLILKNGLFILFIFIIVILEIYYVYLREKEYKNMCMRLEKFKKKLKKVNNEYNYIDNNIERIHKDEIRLKKEKNEISNDIQFYSNELNKMNTLSEKENIKEKESNKTYRK